MRGDGAAAPVNDLSFGSLRRAREGPSWLPHGSPQVPQEKGTPPGPEGGATAVSPEQEFRADGGVSGLCRHIYARPRPPSVRRRLVVKPGVFLAADPRVLVLVRRECLPSSRPGARVSAAEEPAPGGGHRVPAGRLGNAPGGPPRRRPGAPLGPRACGRPPGGQPRLSGRARVPGRASGRQAAASRSPAPQRAPPWQRARAGGSAAGSDDAEAPDAVPWPGRRRSGRRRKPCCSGNGSGVGYAQDVGLNYAPSRTPRPVTPAASGARAEGPAGRWSPRSRGAHFRRRVLGPGAGDVRPGGPGQGA